MANLKPCVRCEQMGDLLGLVVELKEEVRKAEEHPGLWGGD